GLRSVPAKDIFLSDTDEQHCDEPQKRRCGEIAAAQCNGLNAHSASDQHSCSDKSDCRETRDCSIPKKSAECFVNRQTVTVDPTAFESRVFSNAYASGWTANPTAGSASAATWVWSCK